MTRFRAPRDTTNDLAPSLKRSAWLRYLYLTRCEFFTRCYATMWPWRLTLLAPDLVEAVLDGRQPTTMQLQPLLRGFAAEWDRQRSALNC